MKKLWMMGLAALMMLGTTAAQTTAGSQSSGSAATNTSATADKQGAQASTSNAASASQDTTVTDKNKKTKTEAAGASSSSASASASKKGASASLANGSTMQAELTRPVDAKKAKVGDQVMARTTEDVKSEGQVVIPKGSKLMGRVTQAKAKAKGESESSLGIVFDKAVPKGGGPEVPVHAVIQALAAGQAQTAASANEVDTMASGSGMAMGRAEAGRPARSGGAASGGLVSGAGSTVGSTTGVASSAVGNVGGTAGGAAGGAVDSTVNTRVGAAGSAAGLNTAGQLTSASTGVVGLQGLNLSSAAGSSTQGSLITCAERNVRLESSTQMVLRVAAE